MQPIHGLEAALWGIGGAVVARILGMNRVINEEARKQRYRRIVERRTKWQIVVAILRDPFFWITNAAHLSAAVFVILLFIRDGVMMTARLAVFIGAASPALLGDVVGSFSSTVGPPGPSASPSSRQARDDGPGPSS